MRYFSFSQAGPSHLELKFEVMVIVRPPDDIVNCPEPLTLSELDASILTVPVCLLFSRLHSILISCLDELDEITVRVHALSSSFRKPNPFSISSLVTQDFVVVVRGV